MLPWAELPKSSEERWRLGIRGALHDHVMVCINCRHLPLYTKLKWQFFPHKAAGAAEAEGEDSGSSDGE